VVEHLGDPGAVLVLDETGFVKKGAKSVGVQRQYSGTAGRVENCQIGVFLGYASPKGHALIDRALYLPEGWAGDAGRRAGAGVPQEIASTTKPKLGAAMLERALDAGMPCAWVAGDSVYGADRALRRRIEARRRGYVLAVTSGQRLGGRRVDDRAAEVPREGWRRLSAGEGAKGPRLYDWAFLPYRGGAPPGWGPGLLVRRKLDEPDELAFHLTLAPGGTDLAALVRVAATRWTIEACFEAAKAKWGWTSTRSAPGPAGTGTSRSPCWRTPTSPCCARPPSGGEDQRDLAAELLPLTVPEVRRLLWRLVWDRAPEPAAVLRWSDWRRRHQQRARRSHWHRRTGQHEARL
jgi:SRSO17 transposase